MWGDASGLDRCFSEHLGVSSEGKAHFCEHLGSALRELQGKSLLENVSSSSWSHFPKALAIMTPSRRLIKDGGLAPGPLSSQYDGGNRIFPEEPSLQVGPSAPAGVVGSASLP